MQVYFPELHTSKRKLELSLSLSHAEKQGAALNQFSIEDIYKSRTKLEDHKNSMANVTTDINRHI